MRRVLKLCYITDRRALGPAELLPRIRHAAQLGVDLIQIREKDLATRDLVDLVRDSIEAARDTECRLVVNDRLDVALALGTGGVHLGNQSLPARAVRACVSSEFLMGVSCHSLDEVLAAEAAGADYALFGPIFETPSKLAYGPPVGLEKLAEAASRVNTPLLALGGITLERVKSCLGAGASGIAGISIFQNCESLEDRVRALRLQFQL